MEIECTKIVSMAGSCGHMRNNHAKMEEALGCGNRQIKLQAHTPYSSEDRVMLHTTADKTQRRVTLSTMVLVSCDYLCRDSNIYLNGFMLYSGRRVVGDRAIEIWLS